MKVVNWREESCQLERALASHNTHTEHDTDCFSSQGIISMSLLLTIGNMVLILIILLNKTAYADII